MAYMGPDPCAKCEEMLQPFLDRELSEDEYAIAEAHLDECGYCRKRYKFEETLRRCAPGGRRGDAAGAQAEARGAQNASLAPDYHH